MIIIKDAEQAETLKKLANLDVDAQGGATVIIIKDAEQIAALNKLANLGAEA